MDELRPTVGGTPKNYVVLQEIKNIIIVILATLFYSISTYFFVLGNDFAPSGLSGVLAMIEAKANLNLGTFVLLALNAPLLIWGFFKLSKRFAIYTTISVTLLCGSLFVLGQIDPEHKLSFSTVMTIAGETHIDFGKRLFASAISGVCAGISIALSFRIGSSLGGVDIIVALIQKANPRANVSLLLFFANAVIIVASYFVFENIEGVFFSVVYVLIFSKVCEYILNGVKRALKMEVITDQPDELARELIEKLGHSCTVTGARGMYANKEKYLLICVIRNRQIAEFEKILKKYPNTFSFSSSVSEVFGVFYK